MLELSPLHPYQYRQVAEWDYGPQPESTDWQRYFLEMSGADWVHYAVRDEVGSFVGCISLENDHGIIAFHVTTARKKVSSHALAQVLLKKAAEVFHWGHTALVARIPREKRAAAVLALRCGMREWGHTPTLRYFILTKSRFLKNGIKQA